MVETDKRRAAGPATEDMGVYFILKEEGLRKVSGQEYQEGLNKVQRDLVEIYRQKLKGAA